MPSDAHEDATALSRILHLLAAAPAGAPARALRQHTLDTLWEQVTLLMSPVGARAVFLRAVSVAAHTHPWLAAMTFEGGPEVRRSVLLDPAFVPDDAERGGVELLLRCVADVLRSLIGPGLTENVLADVERQVLTETLDEGTARCRSQPGRRTNRPDHPAKKGAVDNELS